MTLTDCISCKCGCWTSVGLDEKREKQVRSISLCMDHLCKITGKSTEEIVEIIREINEEMTSKHDKEKGSY